MSWARYFRDIHINFFDWSNITRTPYSANFLIDHNKFPIISIKFFSYPSFKPSHWKLNDSFLFSLYNKLSINFFISNLLLPINPIHHPLTWWDKQKIKIKYHIILLSKIQHKKHKSNTAL